MQQHRLQFPSLPCRPKPGDSSDEDATDTEDAAEGAPVRRQVYFCSRTHSQLSQFVAELHRTPFAAALSVASLASRKVSAHAFLLTWEVFPQGACLLLHVLISPPCDHAALTAVLPLKDTPSLEQGMYHA
jgi:hypothetical protein